MENLNDLIWTDEEGDGDINPMNANMRPICMIAFCNSNPSPNSNSGCIVCHDIALPLNCL